MILLAKRRRCRRYNSKEYSKRIVYWTGILFFSQLSFAILFTYLCRDITVFMYSIPVTGGVFGASIVFYLNKAKLENILKMKIAYTKFKINLSKLIPPEAMVEVENEFLDLEDALNFKLNDSMVNTINKDVDVQSY